MIQTRLRTLSFGVNGILVMVVQRVTTDDWNSFFLWCLLGLKRLFIICLLTVVFVLIALQ